MVKVQVEYFTKSGALYAAGEFESTLRCTDMIESEIMDAIQRKVFPGARGFVSNAAFRFSVYHPAGSLGDQYVTPRTEVRLVIPDSWRDSEDSSAGAEPPYTPTTNEVLDKATAITQQADTLCETLVCTALSLHGVMGFKGDIGREHKRAASTTEFLKSAILSNLCLRQYTATGDELAIIQCLIPLFKDK